MSIQAQKFSPHFDGLLQAGLVHFAPGLNARALASHVKKLSDFYLIAPGSPTPWDKDYALPATLAYFMPLNGVRMSAVFREVQRFLPAEMITEIWDFGSGLGTTQWILEDQAWLTPRPLFSVEISKPAARAHADLQSLSVGKWKSLPRTLPPPGASVAHARSVNESNPKPGALAIFSYSFLEMQKILPSLELFDHWLILEPSTRERGRALMNWRAQFINAGFEPLAPCTHSLSCPLLTHSARDWCHMRVHFEAPSWWQDIEAHLPMKNRTLTYSYLLSSRTARDTTLRDAVRVIGDTLEEKGKTRQMICRSSKREFLSWLKKNGEPPLIPRGAVIAKLGTYETKSDELRTGHLEWSE